MYNGLNFYPSPVLASAYCRCLCLCVCVYVCINNELVHAITHHPFKLGSPNLDQRCKRLWLRSPVSCRAIDLDLQGQIKLKSPKLPDFEFVRAMTPHPFKLGSPNLDQKCKTPWLRSLLFWGWLILAFNVKFNLKVKISLYLENTQTTGVNTY